MRGTSNAHLARLVEQLRAAEARQQHADLHSAMAAEVEAAVLRNAIRLLTPDRPRITQAGRDALREARNAD